ncbi:hypothetical protein SH501x_003791 [Pirellulaceae bacterium SH501]
MTADREVLAEILTQHLASYRALRHSELAARLESQRHEDLNDVIEGATPDGTTYTIETNILWDDRSKRHVRVISDLSTGKSQCLLGIIPIFTPDIADGFILGPDGTFIGE